MREATSPGQKPTNKVTATLNGKTIDAKTVLKHREVLEHLERAIDHCDHVATTLSNLAVKHG